MSFSFEKQTVECACNYQLDPTEKYNGLLPKQAAKERNPNIYVKDKIPLKSMKEKKVSLKSMKNKSKQISSDTKKQVEERVSGSSQSDKKFFDDDNLQIDFLGRIQPTKETRQWKEKKKAQIQIKSISRVPTKQVYKTQQPVKTQEELIKKIHAPVLKVQQKKQQKIIRPVLPSQTVKVISTAFRKEYPPQLIHLEEPSSPRKQKMPCHRHSSSGLSHGHATQQQQSSPFLKKSVPFPIKEIYPKEIQSVVDEDEDWEEEFSQVISHEWTADDDDSCKDGKISNPMLSMTTNAQISTVKNSYAK